MPNIESSDYPLAFKLAAVKVAEFNVGEASGLAQPNPAPGDAPVAIRVCARALDGMQKDAVVCNVDSGNADSGDAWRMVCDEGPYLNGTDLAPFPLAFYTAGMIASFISSLRAVAKARGVSIDRLEAVIDNRYGMEGSALKGTMKGSALPAELAVSLDCDADDEAVEELLRAALDASPAEAGNRTALTNTFRIRCNGRPVATGAAAPSTAAEADDPESLFEAAPPAPRANYASDIIVKLAGADTLFGVEGGAGSSLTAEQKRSLHVRGIAKLRDDGLTEITTQLFKPIGSKFRFLADDPVAWGGRGRAPSGLAYLSAGVAFCYMTQLGRYAQIVKQDLAAYRIVQDSSYSRPGASPATAAPLDTQVFIASAANEEANRKLVDMGAQTCFLHAALSAACPSTVERTSEALAA